jgi:integral membrane protein
MQSPISFLRHIALAEAVSYLILLGIAMPLKYLAGQPLAVKITGMIHGILFVVFCVALLRAMLEAHWPFRRCALIFIASFIPLVPFFLDRKLKQWEVATP